MTTRTYRNFLCPNGHSGRETTAENDQPYSKPWESVTADGLIQVGTDVRGYAVYKCSTCGDPMFEGPTAAKR